MKIHFYKVKPLSIYFYFVYDGNFIYETGFTRKFKRNCLVANTDNYLACHDSHLNKSKSHNGIFPTYSLEKTFCNELEQYFNNKLKKFSLLKNIWFDNTKEIDYKVYKYLVKNVKFGHVITYKKLAEIFNIHPKHVGVIMRNNKIPILIPCHRVIMSDGSLGGYMGQKIYIKKFLLSLESAKPNQN